MYKVIASSKANLEKDLNQVTKDYPHAGIQILPEYVIVLSGVTETDKKSK